MDHGNTSEASMRTSAPHGAFHTTITADMRVYDELPRWLRELIDHAVVAYSPVQVAQAVLGQGMREAQVRQGFLAEDIARYTELKELPPQEGGWGPSYPTLTPKPLLARPGRVPGEPKARGRAFTVPIARKEEL